MDILDCIVIGAGPGGLTSALYLARFRRRFIVLEDNNSRAQFIPRSHNLLWEADGIKGTDLLKTFRDHLKKYQINIYPETVLSIEKKSSCYSVKTATHLYFAKAIIFATGTRDREPNLPNLTEAVKKGLIRHCSVCDAFEAIDKDIVILCNNAKGIDETIFMKNYTKKISLAILENSYKLSRSDCEILTENNVTIIDKPIKNFTRVAEKLLGFETVDNKKYTFDIFYSSLGAEIQSSLAIELGVHHEDKAILVDKFQCTNLKNFYAVGDVVLGLNQISVALGQAAIAAANLNSVLNK